MGVISIKDLNPSGIYTNDIIRSSVISNLEISVSKIFEP